MRVELPRRLVCSRLAEPGTPAPPAGGRRRSAQRPVLGPATPGWATCGSPSPPRPLIAGSFTRRRPSPRFARDLVVALPVRVLAVPAAATPPSAVRVWAPAPAAVADPGGAVVVVAGLVAAGVVGVATAAEAVTVRVIAAGAGPESPASFTSDAAIAPRHSAATTAIAAIGQRQFGEAASRVRAAAPQCRHHSCEEASGAPQSGHASVEWCAAIAGSVPAAGAGGDACAAAAAGAGGEEIAFTGSGRAGG